MQADGEEHTQEQLERLRKDKEIAEKEEEELRQRLRADAPVTQNANFIQCVLLPPLWLRRAARRTDRGGVCVRSDMNRQVYSGKHETLSERLQKTRHTRQKGTESSNPEAFL
jgi:hypothetical protein